MFLHRVASCFDKAKVRYVLVGGYAVALHGAVRGTLDIDVIIPFEERQFIRAEEALRRIGLHSRIPVGGAEVFRFREEYLRNRNLLAWGFINEKNPLEVVDIVLTHDADKVKGVVLKVAKRNIRVIDRPELIEMKRASGREQDLIDAQALEELG
jgi:hypothetical protein